MSQPHLRRQRALRLVQAQLNRRGSPYFLLLVVLTATGLTGFLASVLLRRAGLSSMAVRYPVCVALAYLVFLFLLFLYVLHRRSRTAAHALPSPAHPAEDAAEVAADSVVEAGLGALDVAVHTGPQVVRTVSKPPTASAESSTSSWSLDLEDNGAAVLAVIVILVLVVTAFATTFVVLLEAPVLLAEVLVDGVLVAGMARRLQRTSPNDWVFSVIRRTWFPAVVTALVFLAGGALLESLAPNATTMGEALAELR